MFLANDDRLVCFNLNGFFCSSIIFRSNMFCDVYKQFLMKISVLPKHYFYVGLFLIRKFQIINWLN